MAERDVVVQLKPSEAKLILLALRSSQELLDVTAEFIPSTAHYAEERTQQLSKLRALMYRVLDAPTTDQYTPHEVGGVVLLQYETGHVLAWGPNMEHITGWSEEDMRGRVGWQTMGLADTRVEAFLERLETDTVLKAETDIPTKWGKSTRVFYRAEMVSCQTNGHPDRFVIGHVWPV